MKSDRGIHPGRIGHPWDARTSKPRMMFTSPTGWPSWSKRASGTAQRSAARLRLRTGASARRVSLTVAPSGNTSRTSGEMTPTFVPWAYLCAVTSRFPWEKSYSGRMVSSSAALPSPGVFILPPFRAVWPVAY